MLDKLNELKVSMDNLITVFEDASYTTSEKEAILNEFINEVNNLKK